MAMKTKKDSLTVPESGWEFKYVTAHLSEVLLEDFLKPMGITQNRLAVDLHVPATRIGEIIAERRSITPDTALRLARYFNMSAAFWLNLQQIHDLSKTQKESAAEIKREVKVYAKTEAAPA